MIEIKDLLSRFNPILSRGEGRAESVRQVISEVIKTDIKKEEINIKDGTVYLNIKPIYKNEILLKQEEIISRLEKILGQKAPRIIR